MSTDWADLKRRLDANEDVEPIAQELRIVILSKEHLDPKGFTRAQVVDVLAHPRLAWWFKKVPYSPLELDMACGRIRAVIDASVAMQGFDKTFRLAITQLMQGARAELPAEQWAHFDALLDWMKGTPS